MGAAVYCDRCGAQFYTHGTVRVQPLTEAVCGMFVENMNGAQTAELCEACAVELVGWLKPSGESLDWLTPGAE